MEVSALTHPVGLGRHGRSPLLRLQSDEHLITLIRAGSDPAFEALVDRYRPRLLAFCRHMLRSPEDAEDILQEALAAAYRAIHADDRPIQVRGWLYRIARNRCLNHLRRTPAVGLDSMDVLLAEHGESVADKVHRREEFRLLMSDIRALAETQRTALILREMEALSYEDIAEAMETTVPSVKSLLVRARVALAEASEARALSCEQVRLELGEVAEGLLARAGQPVRRHLRDCDRCRAFQGHLRQTNRRLAAFAPFGPFALWRSGLFSHAGGSSGAGASGLGASSGVGMGSGWGGLSAGVSWGSVAAGALATKAAAGLAAAALLTAGAVVAENDAARSALNGVHGTRVTFAVPAAALGTHAHPSPTATGASPAASGAESGVLSRSASGWSPGWGSRRQASAAATTSRVSRRPAGDRLDAATHGPTAVRRLTNLPGELTGGGGAALGAPGASATALPTSALAGAAAGVRGTLGAAQDTAGSPVETKSGAGSGPGTGVSDPVGSGAGATATATGAVAGAANGSAGSAPGTASAVSQTAGAVSQTAGAVTSTTGTASSVAGAVTGIAGTVAGGAGSASRTAGAAASTLSSSSAATPLPGTR